MKLSFHKLQLQNYVPKLYQCMHGYSGKQYMLDTSAAIIIALAALPLSMGYAMSAGLSPHLGIYCTVIAGFIAPFLSGGRCQITGPTAGFDPFVLALCAGFGLDGLFTGVFLAGLILIVLGAVGLGSIVKFLPRPIVLGITNGIGLFLIIVNLKKMLGLVIPNWLELSVPGKVMAMIYHLPELSLPSTIISIATIAGIIWFQKYKSLPGPLIVTAALAGIVAVAGINIATIGSQYDMPTGFQLEHIPTFKFDLVPDLAGTSMTIALLVALKTLLTATISDRMLGDKHNPNVELISQGAANMGSAFVGGLPSTASISRTANNIRLGGRTPISGLMVSVILLSVLFFAAPAANLIPICALAAIMAHIGHIMADWAGIPKILKSSKADIAVWALTFVLTTLGKIDLAMQFGFILAAALYVQKVSATTSVGDESDLILSEEATTNDEVRGLPEGAKVYNIRGPFMFGTSDKLHSVIDKVDEQPPVVILRLKSMTAIDATGIAAFETLAQALKDQEKQLVICALREQPGQLLKRAKFDEFIGTENHCMTTGDAVRRAKQILDSDPEYSKKSKRLAGLDVENR